MIYVISIIDIHKQKHHENLLLGFLKMIFVLIKAEEREAYKLYVTDRPTQTQDQKHFKKWGISSAGRAPALHAGGQRFDPAILHHFSRFALQKANSRTNVRYVIFLKHNS